MLSPPRLPALCIGFNAVAIVWFRQAPCGCKSIKNAEKMYSLSCKRMQPLYSPHIASEQKSLELPDSNMLAVSSMLEVY